MTRAFSNQTVRCPPLAANLSLMSTPRSISAHLDAVLALASTPPAESAPVDASLSGRVLAADATARFPVPPHANSAMDGFLVHAADLSSPAPWTLPVAGDVPAGAAPIDVPVGHAVRIMTGAPVADTAGMLVVPVENTTTPAGPVALPDEVTITEAPTRSHIRPPGEDIQPGAPVATVGTLIDAAVIAALTSAGVYSVSTYRRPRIAVISSGEELVSSPAQLTPGQLPDSNGPMLAALAGANAHVHVGDAPADLASALDELAPSHDLIITSGGVSAGAFDVVHTVLGRADSAWFGHVDQRPGAPQGYSLWNDTPVLCLPGNPVAAFVDFQLYARPLIAALSGHPAPRQRVNLPARVDSPLPASRGRPTIVPVTVDFQAAPAITSHLPHGSHRIVSLAGTNGFCLIDSEPPAMGEDITVYLY